MFFENRFKPTKKTMSKNRKEEEINKLDARDAFNNLRLDSISVTSSSSPSFGTESRCSPSTSPIIEDMEIFYLSSSSTPSLPPSPPKALNDEQDAEQLLQSFPSPSNKPNFAPSQSVTIATLSNSSTSIDEDNDDDVCSLDPLSYRISSSVNNRRFSTIRKKALLSSSSIVSFSSTRSMLSTSALLGKL